MFESKHKKHGTFWLQKLKHERPIYIDYILITNLMH